MKCRMVVRGILQSGSSLTIGDVTVTLIRPLCGTTNLTLHGLSTNEADDVTCGGRGWSHHQQHIHCGCAGKANRTTAYSGGVHQQRSLLAVEWERQGMSAA